MSPAASDSLARDSLRAARGVLRLILFNPAWAEDFDLSRLGLIRSFFAQGLRAPLVILFACALARAEGDGITRELMLQAAAALAIGVAGELPAPVELDGVGSRHEFNDIEEVIAAVASKAPSGP